MEVIESEIRAREGSSAMESKGYRPAKEHSTGATLLIGGSTKLSCCFCKRSIFYIMTAQLTLRPENKSRGGVIICLTRNHITRSCCSNIKCTKCNGRHHVAICPARLRCLNKSIPPSGEPSHTLKLLILQTLATKLFGLLKIATATALNPEDPSKTN